MEEPLLELVEESSIPESASLNLVGAREIQDLFKVGRIRAYQITCRRGFPAPVAELGSGRIWIAEDVEEWIKVNRPWNVPSVTSGEALDSSEAVALSADRDRRGFAVLLDSWPVMAGGYALTSGESRTKTPTPGSASVSSLARH